jgi:hypothetical protein
VVVEVGATDTAPPPAAIVRLLPFVPVIVIPVAFVAVTVKVLLLPLVIDVGLALMVTVGAVAASTAWLLKPIPANASIAHGRSVERTERTTFMNSHRQFSLPRICTRKEKRFNTIFVAGERRRGGGKTYSSYIGNNDIALGLWTSFDPMKLVAGPL